MTDPNNVFDLKWNKFSSHLVNWSRDLLEETDSQDISIRCGETTVTAHKLVLSACSPWFRSVISSLPPSQPRPLVVLWDTEVKDMRQVLTFMYRGEVQVQQDNLIEFLKLAGRLEVKGLTEDKPKVEDVGDVEEGDNMAVSDGDKIYEARHQNFSNNSNALKDYKATKDMFVKAEQNKKDTTDKTISYNESRINTFKDKVAKNILKTTSTEKVQMKKQKLIREIMEEVHRKSDSKENIESFKNFAESAGNVQDDEYDIDYNEHLKIQALIDKQKKSLETGHGATQEDKTDFDPSLVVKTELEEMDMDEQVIDSKDKTTHASQNSNDPCDICGKGPFRNMKAHKKQVHTNELYECTSCNKSFKQPIYLRRHKATFCKDRFA